MFRPEAVLRLVPGKPQKRLEIEPYDTDWENCGACVEASDLPCRYHSGVEAGYQALHRPLLDAMAQDPAVTVATVLQRLADDDGSDNDTVSGTPSGTAHAIGEVQG